METLLTEMVETVFTNPMTHSNFSNIHSTTTEPCWGGPCDHCDGETVAFFTINFTDGGSVGGYLCRRHLNELEAAYGLPRSADVPTGRTGEDSLDAERDDTSGAVPVGARSHKPDPKRVGSHCRVDCSCGWKGPKVPMFGQGHKPWVEHFKEADADAALDSFTTFGTFAPPKYEVTR